MNSSHVRSTRALPSDLTRLMKLDKPFAAAASILLVAAGLIGLTWLVAGRWVRTERAARLRHVERLVSDQASAVTGRINRQILAVDQTLRMMAAAWRADPAHFKLETWRRDAVVLDGLNWQMLMTDAHGIVRQASAADAINLNAAGMDYFRALANPSVAPDAFYIGPAAIDDVMRQWHLNIARALRRPDGSFAGVIDADYRLDAITNALGDATLGANPFGALVGLRDGRLRAAIGATGADPGVVINGTRMLAAMRKATHGIWIGPSAPDTIVRVQAFDRLPRLDLAVVVGMDLRDAMRPVAIFQRQVRLGAAALSLAIIALAAALIQGTRLARRRKAEIRADQAERAAADARADVALASVEAMAAQLEATLAGIPDGVAVFDAQLCLATWNPRFAARAGLPPAILRVGLPFEEMTRQQIAAGQFGAVPDPAHALRLRMSQLRATPTGVAQWTRADGTTVQISHKLLPNGGLITLYSDITEQQRAGETLDQARAAVERTKADKAGFAAIIRDECQQPLNQLQQTIDRLRATPLDTPQTERLSDARRACERLSGLIQDILDVAALDAGTLALQPELVDIRDLATDSIAASARHGEQADIPVALMISDDAPETLFGDAARLRQLLANLLAHAMAHAGPGTIRLTITSGQRPEEAIRITVRDAGPLLPARVRDQLSAPPSGLSGELGLALLISRHLVTLMGGTIGCEASPRDDAPQGNLIQVTLPTTMLPYRDTTPPMPRDAADALPNGETSRPPPRCHILLAADQTAHPDIIAGILRREGHAVRITPLAHAGAEIPREWPFDLVLIDTGSGPQDQAAADRFARLIRQLPPPGGGVPIIAVTGNRVLPHGVGIDGTGIDGSGIDGAGIVGAMWDASVARPLSLPELRGLIRRHVWFGGMQRPSAPPDRDADFPLIAAEKISQLRAMYPPDQFAARVEDSLVAIDRRMPALRRAVLSRTVGQIAVHADALAGVAAGYGMVRLEARLRDILGAVRAGDLTPFNATLLADLDAVLEATKQRLHALENGEPA